MALQPLICHKKGEKWCNIHVNSIHGYMINKNEILFLRLKKPLFTLVGVKPLKNRKSCPSKKDFKTYITTIHSSNALKNLSKDVNLLNRRLLLQSDDQLA